MICKDFGTNKEHVKSKMTKSSTLMTKSSTFIELLSRVCLVLSQVGIASTLLGLDADARSVVWRTDKFNAGGFQSVSDGI